MTRLLNLLWSSRRALVFYACLLAAGWAIGHVVLNASVPEVQTVHKPMFDPMILGALAIYVLAAAIPFVPGAEIGFALLLMFGARASLMVYAGMVGALLLAYIVARVVPLPLLSRFARWLRLSRLSTFVDDLDAIPRQDRAAVLAQRFDSGPGHTMFRNRYILLALLLNLPGNSILGGGGGLAFMAGVSGLYSFWPYLIAVLIAVAPFPLMFLLMG